MTDYSKKLDEFQAFSTDLFEKQKEKAIRLIMESIKLTLRPIPQNLGKTYGYWNIVRCSRANTYMGDETIACVDEALGRLNLIEEFSYE
jgi:hypothetical protein